MTAKEIIGDILPILERWVGDEHDKQALEATWKLMQQLGMPPAWWHNSFDMSTLSQRARAVQDKV